jgi:hypothetical protein
LQAPNETQPSKLADTEADAVDQHVGGDENGDGHMNGASAHHAGYRDSSPVDMTTSQDHDHEPQGEDSPEHGRDGGVETPDRDAVGDVIQTEGRSPRSEPDRSEV